MTEVPDQERKDSGNEPEPPIDQLYALYCESLRHDRKKMMAGAILVFKDPDLEEAIAKAFQPVPLGEFRQHLDELAERGVWHILVNRLVRGPMYCDANPDDESINMPPEEQTKWMEGFQKDLRDALRDNSPNRPPGSGGARRG